MREAKRTNAAYRPHALRALGQISQAREVNLMPHALAIIGPVIDEVLEDQEKDGDKMDVDGKAPDSTETLAACVECLLQCLNPATAEPKGTFLIVTPDDGFWVINSNGIVPSSISLGKSLEIPWENG